MKTGFCAAVGLLTAGLNTAHSLTYQQQISGYDAEDFAFQLGGPEPEALVDGFQLRSASVRQLPALEGQGISMSIVNLGPCAINQPHTHPRATEMLYMIEGNDLRVAFVEEFGGEGSVVNDLSKGDVSFVPQGLVHYQQNLGCEPTTFLVSLNSEDPGAIVLITLFFELPSGALQAILNIDDPALLALLTSLPIQPALARQQCLERCGLLDEDGDFDDMSYSYDSGDI